MKLKTIRLRPQFSAASFPALLTFREGRGFRLFFARPQNSDCESRGEEKSGSKTGERARAWFRRSVLSLSRLALHRFRDRLRMVKAFKSGLPSHVIRGKLPSQSQYPHPLKGALMECYVELVPIRKADEVAIRPSGLA